MSGDGFDISDTLAPTSDQLDALELLQTGPRIFTVESVSKGSVEQPVQVKLAEFPRVWRPSKGMRRVLAAGWGVQPATWRGHRVELFCDETVTFGRERPGGTRISRMSHLPNGAQLSVPLQIARERYATYRVEPLVEVESSPTAADVAGCADRETLRGWWQAATPDVRAAIQARVAELDTPDDEPESAP